MINAWHKNFAPLWYVFTMNAITNAPFPPCLDAVVAVAEVEAEAVACPIPSLSTSVPPTPLGCLHCNRWWPSTSWPIIVVFHAIIAQCPTTALSVSIRGSPLPILLNSFPGGRRIPFPLLLHCSSRHLCHCWGNHDCWCVVATPSLSCHPTFVAAAIAMILVVVTLTSLGTWPSNGIFPTIGTSDKLDNNNRIATGPRGRRQLLPNLIWLATHFPW
jgi:hypothetical protein